MPRWGLRDAPARPPGADAPGPLERVIGTAQVLQVLLVTLAVTAAAGAVAEVVRYGVALRGRTELLPAGLVATSDAAVVTTGLLAPLFGLAAAVVAARWLVRARRVAARARGRRDTRRAPLVVAGVLVPVADLVLAPVWLAELEQWLDPEADLDRRPRPSRLLRAWWAVWAAGQVLVAVALAYRVWGRSVQSQADSIVVAAWSDTAAAACAVLTLLLLRRCTAALTGTTPGRRRARRWVASVPSRPAAAPTPTEPADAPADDGLAVLVPGPRA